MQLETAASAFVSGLVRKDVRTCPILARPAAPDHHFHAPSRCPETARGCADGRTSSGRVAVQVVWKYCRASRDIEHIGSPHTDAHPDRQFVLPGRGHPAVVTAEDLPDDLRQALAPIHTPGCARVWPKSGVKA